MAGQLEQVFWKLTVYMYSQFCLEVDLMKVYNLFIDKFLECHAIIMKTLLLVTACYLFSVNYLFLSLPLRKADNLKAYHVNLRTVNTSIKL